MLQVKEIVKYYGNNKAVDHLSFSVKDGEIFGLLGENGAGKNNYFPYYYGSFGSDRGRSFFKWGKKSIMM